MNLPDRLISQVRRAALESYDGHCEEFSEFEPKQLFKIAYLHGYNCAYNIYDVAEERINGLIKKGENPVKDVPLKSVSVTDRAENYININKTEMSGLNNKELYEHGYEQGFNDVWNSYIDIRLTDELEDLVNYYLSGNRNSTNISLS